MPIRVLLLFLILVNCSYAQREAPKKTLRVAALQIVGSHHTLWLRTGPGKDAIEIPLNTRIFSVPIIYKGPAKASFYGSEKAATSKEPPAPLCTTMLDTPSTLLIFAPTKKADSYQALSIAEKEFPFGSFRLANFSTVRVRAELGRKATILSPGKAQSFSFPERQDAMPVRILAEGPNNKNRVIRQTSWSIVPSQRELVLFFPNPANGLAGIRHFVDSRPPVE